MKRLSKARFAKARREADSVVAVIKPILAGRDPAVIGLALAELMALLIAGHPKEVREEILKLHIATVRELYPAAAAHFGTDIPREPS